MAQIEKTVFICYRRKDISWALAVYQYLTSQKYDVFFDYKSIKTGDFEQVIVSNIKARAHFVIILTPTALNRCVKSGDWLSREIETAMEHKRNVVPLFFKGFSFGSSPVWNKLTGRLRNLDRYNGMNIHQDYFEECMERLDEHLQVPLDAVLHPVSVEVQNVVKEAQAAADKDAPRLLGVKLLPKDESAETVREENNGMPEREGRFGTLAEQASSKLVQQEPEAMRNIVPESAISLPPGPLAFYPTVELALRKLPVISPDTVIRRIPITERLVSLEDSSVAIQKVGIEGKWLKVKDASGTVGYITAWLVRPSIAESAKGTLRTTEGVKGTLKIVPGSLAEEASSELVQQELEAMSQAVPEDIEGMKEPVVPLTLRLQQIVQEFAYEEIGRDTPKEVLNDILAHLPKTQDVKG